MGRPLFLVENVFNEIMFPDHVVDASSSLAQAQPWRVGDGRRRPDDRWTPAAANAPAWIRAAFPAARTVDALAIDRGHNLAGRALQLQASDDGFVADVRVLLDVVLPAASTEDASIDDAAGALTREGAWLVRFPAESAKAFRIWFPALGADLRPTLVGVWLGRCYVPEHYFDLPWSDEGLDLQYQPTTSPAGWMGPGRASRARAGDVALKLRDEAEYRRARYHLQELWCVPRPGWVVYDDSQAEKAVLGLPMPGRIAFPQEMGWFPRQGRISWIEHEPQVR